MSRQQTRIDLLRSNVLIITERRDKALKLLMRWESSRIDMEARLKRALKRAEQGVTEIAPTADELTVRLEAHAEERSDTASEICEAIKSDNLNIPDFLDRRKAVDEEDARIAATLLTQQAARKRLKSLNRIAKMKAKAAGELAKMPLTGKAALEAIRGKK